MKTKMQMVRFKGSKYFKDHISSLPNDILINIVSLLDLNEAYRTCVLSKRWRHVWTNLSDLDFDGLATLYKMWEASEISDELYDTLYESEQPKFVHMVNHVVSSSTAPSINRFRVRFLLDDSSEDDIRTWLNFAMGKRVKELELNLTGYYDCDNAYDPIYLDSFRRYARYPSVHSLVSLSLVGVKISGSFLESVLSNFPNLERLSMRSVYCGHSNLKVVGDSLKLRHLEISFCFDFGKLEISAKNLISLVYRVCKQETKFICVPLLNEVEFEGPSSIFLVQNLHHSGFVSQLTKLMVNMREIQDIIQSSRFESPHFKNLKELDVRFSDAADRSLLVFTKLINTCPLLHKFTLRRIFYEDPDYDLQYIRNETKKHHRCLSIFEMVGFRGAQPDIELVLFLAEIAIVFEKIILDPHGPFDEGKPTEENNLEQIEETRKEARLLQNKLPAKVQMQLF